MKKTSFTKTHGKMSSLLSWLIFACLSMLCQDLVAQLPLCPGGSVTPAAPGSPAADANCMVATPNVVAAATVVAPAGYTEFARVQLPNAGTLVNGLGPHTIYVDVLFHETGNFANMCVVQTTINFSGTDNTGPTVTCASPVTLDLPSNSCQINLTSALIQANLINDPGTFDNCTPDANLVYSSPSHTILAGPTCGGGGSVAYNVTVRVTDQAGNSTDCVSNVTVRDNTGPGLTCPPNTTVFVDPAPGTCTGQIPNLTGLVTIGTDNCDPGGGMIVTQSPAPGTIYNIPTGCGMHMQPANVLVQDCFGNGSTCDITVIFKDNTAPTITSACPAPNSVVLTANASCQITIPDLRGGLTAQDNCASTAAGTITFTQNPPPGPFQVGGCVSNSIDVTFTATDCNGNTSTSQVCPGVITWVDNMAPTIVCPATPITVVVPFDNLTCQHGVDSVTLAEAIAAGVTITDNCDPNPVLTGIAPNMFMCPDIAKAGLTVTLYGRDCRNNRDTMACAVNVVKDIDLTAAWSIPGGDFIVCPSEFPVSITLGPNTPGCGVWSGDVAVTGTAPGPYTLVAGSFPDTDSDGIPDPGSYSLTYTVGPPGCHVSETHNIMVSPQFVQSDAALTADFTICLERHEVFDLGGLLLPGSVPGGLFTIVSTTGSLTGSLNGHLWQYLGGDGDLTVRYTLTDCTGVAKFDEVVITIDEKPQGYFTLPADQCQDGGIVDPVISGIPSMPTPSYTFSFASMPAGFIINPSAGVFRFDPAAGPLSGEFVDVNVTMTVTNGTCPAFTLTQTVRVHASGDPTFNLPSSVCETAPPVNLALNDLTNDGIPPNDLNNLIPSNVTWTGIGVVENPDGVTATFNGASVGPGKYQVCVTVGSPNCEELYCDSITVLNDYTLADVRLANDTSLCLLPGQSISYSDFMATSAMDGGTFNVLVTDANANTTLLGTNTGSAFIYTGGCGTLTLTYFFPLDCDPAGTPKTSDQIVVTIEERPDVGGFSMPGPLCAQDAPVTINNNGTSEVCGNPGTFTHIPPAGVTPLGGAMTTLVPGVAARFNPALSGEGTHTIVYEIGNPVSGCYATFNGQITVNASSSPAFTVPSEVCPGQVVNLQLTNPNYSVYPHPGASATPGSDGNVEVRWFGGDGNNAIVTNGANGTATFVADSTGNYTVCVVTGDIGCIQTECHDITVDNEEPVIACPANPFVRGTDATCRYTAVGTEFNVTATDNCTASGALTYTHNYPLIGTGLYGAVSNTTLAGAIFPHGITQVEWKVKDVAGNYSTCTIEVIVNDDDAPTVATCPANIAVGTDPTTCGAIITYATPTFNDNCDGQGLLGTLTSGYASGTLFPLGVTTVTWQYTDLDVTAPNTPAVCTFTVTITDDDRPVAICVPAYTVQLGPNGMATVLATDIDNGSYDNCGIVSTLISRDGTNFAGNVSFNCADAATPNPSNYTVTLRVVDAAGNQQTCTTTVTVVDTQVPDIECPDNIVVNNAVGLCNQVVTYPAPTVTDNCSFTVAQTAGLPSGGTFPVGVTTNTYVATDIDGNQESCSFTVTVLDAEAPVLNCSPTDRVRNADPGLCTFTMPGTGFDVTATDNCPGAITFTHNYPVTAGHATSVNTLAGATFPVGITQVVWTATDAAGNFSICTIEIHINDVEPPVLVGVPANMTVQCDAIPAPAPVTATDNCPDVDLELTQVTTSSLMGTLSGAQEVPANSSTATGMVTGDVTDPNGVFNITVSFTGLSANVTAAHIHGGLPGANGPVVIDLQPLGFPLGVTSGNFNATINLTPGQLSNLLSERWYVNIHTSNFPGGEIRAQINVKGVTSIVRTWKATDEAGNMTSASQTLTVVDTKPPVFQNCPTTMVMIGNDVDQCSGKLNWSIPVATDNCSDFTVVQTGGPVSGTVVPVGVPQTVTYTATDVFGNSSVCTFQVQVVDTQKPDFDADIVMPGDITVECHQVPAPFVLTLNDVHDNCPGPLTINYTQTSTQCSNNTQCCFYTYTITRTWTVTDVAGNQRIHVQVITVRDTTKPTAVCTSPVTITLDKSGVATIDPRVVGAGSTDNCAPFSALTITASQTTFTCANLGANTVTITVTDPCGNFSTCTATVNVLEGPGSCTPQYDAARSIACNCLNNATTLSNGQFGELIQIKALAMQNWTVASSTGMYTVNSPNPPAAPIAVANGTAMTAGTADQYDNDGDGQIDEADEMIYYTINIRHVDEIGFMATFTNGSQSVTVMNTCYYPTPVVTLEDPFCLSTPPFVPVVTDLYAGSNAYTSINFLVDGVPVTQVNPGTLSIGQHTLTVIVNAGAAKPARKVNGVPVPGDATGTNGRLDPGCIQSITEVFEVITTPTQVVCNDLIQVSLEANCTATVTPDMVLEGSYGCYDDYEVHIYQPGGAPLNPFNVVTGAHAGMTLNYVLVHPTSGNICWGNILVEDKLDPIVSCPPNRDILCTIDPDSIVCWVPVGHCDYPAKDACGNLVPVGGTLLYLCAPTVTDCSNTTWTYTDDFEIYECSDNASIVQRIERTFVVTDQFGNQSTCTQIIRKLRGEASQVTFPVDVEFDCDNIPSSVLPDFSPQSLELLFPNTNYPRCAPFPAPPFPTCYLDPHGWPEIGRDNNITTTGTGVCGLGVSYSDQIVNLCNNSYKVVRTWTIFDWCPANGGAPTQTTHVQYIKIINVAPRITFDYLQMDPATGLPVLNATEDGNPPHYPCYAVAVPFAIVDPVCDQIVDVTVTTPAGDTPNGGLMPAPGLAVNGIYDLIYRAEDQCGNITLETLTVVVRDRTAPTTLCDEITDVNLSSDGMAVVPADVFDDGSYDNCCLDRFEVRRMNAGCGTGTSFGPTVKFCCADVGAPVTVVFRAVDCNGNTNECMVQVNVNDKEPPVVTHCPANSRITCDWYGDNLESVLNDPNKTSKEKNEFLSSKGLGDPTFYDNCPITLEHNVQLVVDNCYEGTIVRQWRARDAAGNVSGPSPWSCTQRIFVDHVSDFVVEFPADKDVDCVPGMDPVAEFGLPEIFFETCELVAVSHEDTYFDDVSDACYKIVRQWTVINWCVTGANVDQEVVEASERQFQIAYPNLPCDLDGDGDCDTRTFRDSWNLLTGNHPNTGQPYKQKPQAIDAQGTGTQIIYNPDTDPDSDPWDGFITYEQIIKVTDDIDPDFVDCAVQEVEITGNTCSATIVLNVPEVDDCSKVELTARIQIGGTWFNAGTILINPDGTTTGTFTTYNNIVPGSYPVEYKAVDECNNWAVCNTTVNVVDKKKPTPYCQFGLIIELMNTDPAMVQVWANDFNVGSFDNCPGNLKFSFSSNVNDIGRTYTCDELGEQVVQMWVTDAAGNQDYCETFVIIQANMNQCDSTSNPLIAGRIQTETQIANNSNDGVAGVEVQLSGNNQMAMTTAQDGMFSFDVTSGGDYTITPVKDNGWLNGVTTFDLVLISKHILATQLLDSPYKMIAADANKSNSITTFDLVQLRKLILLIDSELPNNTSWRFVDKNYGFPNPQNPWAEVFPEVANYNNVAANQLGANFVAVKVGDVNGNATTGLTGGADERNANGNLVFNVDKADLKAGQEYTVNFKATNFDVFGYQFTLSFDQAALEFVQVNPAVAKAENFGLTLLEKGVITTSWNNNDTRLNAGDVVFSLTFRAIEDVKLEDVLSISKQYTVAEAYRRNGDLLDVKLAFNGSTVADQFELYQNTPNPFSVNTVIGFNLPQASEVTLKITDVSGKVVKMLNGDYGKGYNEIKLDRRDLPTAGILYYQLDTPTDSATKMMLLVD
jgi:hypothetical protein